MTTIFKWIGWGVVYIGLGLLFHATIGRQSSAPSLSWRDYFEIVGVTCLGLYILFASLQSQQRTSDEEAKNTFAGGTGQGSAPFSLFLRSFDITGKLKIERPASLPFMWDQYDRPGNDTLERLLADAVVRTAPLIGLGGHGDVEFGPGLAGFVEDWQGRVEKAMNEAAYVFIVPSANVGTLWEIGVLKNRGYLDRTIFVMPPSIPPFKFTGDGEYKDFWEAARIACANEHQMELPPYRPNGGLFQMGEKTATRGKPFVGFEPRDVAKTINKLIKN